MLLSCIVWEDTQAYNSSQAGIIGYVTNVNTLTNYAGVNPEFVAPLPRSAAPTTAGDYSLTYCSPALNAGTTGFFSVGTIDLVGNARFFGPNIDMGAYEFQSPPANPVVVPAITGDSILCLGSSDTLFNAVAGGVWRSLDTTIATISPTGIVTSVAAGNAVITYTHGTTGCPVATAKRTIAITTANSLLPITGTDSVCSGSTIQLSNVTPWGTWSTSNPAIAIVDANGLVTGISSGVATILYTYGLSACSSVVSKTVTVNPVPVVPSSTRSGAAVCVGGTQVQYYNAVPSGVWSTAYYNGTVVSISSTGLVTAISTSTSTIYMPAYDNIYYTVTNIFGCSARTGSSTVYVYDLPSVPTDIVARDTICLGDTARLALPYNPAWTYTYSSGDSTVATLSSTGNGTAILTGTGVGSVTISAIVFPAAIYGGATCSTMKTKTIVVLPPPTAAPIFGSDSVCLGNTLQLTNNTSGGRWGTSSGGAVSTINAAGLLTSVNAGTDTVYYIVANAGGCADTAVKTLFVKPPPSISPTTGLPTSMCTGNTAQLVNPVAGGVWSTSSNGMLSAINNTGLITATSPGEDTIWYTVTNSFGCSAAAYSTTTINAPQQIPITGLDSLCVGSTITLNHSSTAGTWTNFNLSVGNISSMGQYTATMAGTDTVFYQYISNGCTVQVEKTMKTIEANTTVSQNSAVLTATGNQTGATYQWVNCDNNYQPISGATNATYVATSNGRYAVIVDYMGCQDTSTCLTVSGLGIDEIKQANSPVIVVLTNRQIQINTGSEKVAALRLYDMQGRLVREASPYSSLVEWNVSDLAAGVYVLHTYFKDGTTVQKLVIP